MCLKYKIWGSRNDKMVLLLFPHESFIHRDFETKVDQCQWLVDNVLSSSQYSLLTSFWLCCCCCKISSWADSKVPIPIAGDHSTLLVSFHLKRHMGDFVIQVHIRLTQLLDSNIYILYLFLYYVLVQVYGPCILLVVISWVSFWLNREATSDRISLGEGDTISNSDIWCLLVPPLTSSKLSHF